MRWRERGKEGGRKGGREGRIVPVGAVDEDGDAVVVQEVGDEEGGGEDLVDMEEPVSAFHLGEGGREGEREGRCVGGGEGGG